MLTAVGVAWPNRLAVFALCISVLQYKTTDLVSISQEEASARTLIVCAGCTWVEISV